MNIRESAFNLQKVYEEMSSTFDQFQKKSGLSCLEGCGRCCQNPEIEASVFELLPWALKIHDEGKTDEWFDRLQTMQEDPCALLMNGKCTSYDERPSLCRMFGVGGYFDKKHEHTLAVCKYIKEAYPEVDLENLKKQAPMISEWSSKIPHLDNKLPINQALLAALEKVALHHQFLSDHISFN